MKKNPNSFEIDALIAWPIFLDDFQHISAFGQSSKHGIP